jgi:hypothetical protein
MGKTESQSHQLTSAGAVQFQRRQYEPALTRVAARSTPDVAAPAP